MLNWFPDVCYDSTHTALVRKGSGTPARCLRTRSFTDKSNMCAEVSFLVCLLDLTRIIEIGGNNTGLDFRKCSGNRTCSSDVILHVLVNYICLRLHLAR